MEAFSFHNFQYINSNGSIGMDLDYGPFTTREFALKIGGVPLKQKIFLAPMAGITDRSFRVLCRTFGAGLAYSEMVSAKSIVYNNPRTWQLLETCPQERPWAVQLFGHEPDVFAEAIKKLEEWPFDILDINMGCPVAKIIKNGEGCALMNDPALAGRIIESAVRASSRPVTVKIRKGFSPARTNAAEIARVAQESGAAAVTVHGRTKDQFYSGKADWDCIAEVKRAVNIPVIGNGDVFAPEDTARMMAHTGCDAVMIARGALGNPWLFTETLFHMETGYKPAYPGWEQKRDMALSHLRMAVAHKGEGTALREMRRHLSWYTKGFPDAAKNRQLINTARSMAELEAVFNAGGQSNG
jgi:nifR3 family TIM-barrel protein